MRFPHLDASAASGRGGLRQARLMVPVLLAAVTGCVVQQTPRVIEGEVALGQINPQRTATPVARPDTVAGTGRPGPRPSGDPQFRTASAPRSAVTPAAPSVPQPVGPTSALPSPTTAPATAPGTPANPGGPGGRVLVASAHMADQAPTPAPARGADPVDPEVNVVVPAPSVIPPPSGEYPIDLATALRLADVANPTIGRARTVILEALAQQLTARTLLVPSLNGGASYHGQNGVLQRSSGKMLLVSEQSLYIGGGAFTVAAETLRIPMVNILTPLTDAWFEPLVAQQRVDATRFLARATENDVLLEVATLQLELIRHFTLLETHRLSESQAFEIVRAIRGYAITGEGREADFERAKAEWKYRRADVIDAEQGVGIATARLAQRLNLNPSVRLHPAGGPLVPLELVALDTPREQLIQIALQQRPDLAARGAEIRQAQFRVKEEIGRPLLPTLWLGFSGGAFGGGSDLSPPLLARFAGRTDFDVRVYWTLLNFGAGNAALIRDRQAEAGQAIALQARTINRVRSEVIAALADAKSQRNQIEVARRELMSSREGFHEDLTRSRENLGRPIEVINSLNLLAAARAHLIDAIVRYDQAQFRLWVALGSPPPLVETSSPDQPPIPDYLRP